jgi:hypothetical protein
MNREKAKTYIGKRVRVWTSMRGEYEGVLTQVIAKPGKPWRGVVRVDDVLAEAFTQGWKNSQRKTKQAGEEIEVGGIHVYPLDSDSP